MDTGRAGNILVVDDDEEICDLIRSYLEDEGYSVSTAGSAGELHKIMPNQQFDAVFVDIRLPDGDGFSLVKDLRGTYSGAILMLTGKQDVVDRVAGLEVGADDYITKPFHLRELLARLRTVLRRSIEARAVPRAASETGRSYQFASWRLDPEGRTLCSPTGEFVNLTSGEFDLLLTFVEHPKRVLSRDQILDLARGREAAMFDRSIDVQVGRLRRKIESDPKRPALIKTVRNAGYMFNADVTIG